MLLIIMMGDFNAHIGLSATKFAELLELQGELWEVFSWLYNDKKIIEAGNTLLGLLFTFGLLILGLKIADCLILVVRAALLTILAHLYI